jgi:hypothetical protein
MQLKNEDIQKMVYKHLDKNLEVKSEVIQKILTNARVYRSKYIGFTAEDAKEKVASRIAELISNAVVAYINERFTGKMEFINSEKSNLNLEIDTADKIIKFCSTDSSCNQNQLALRVILYKKNLEHKRNNIEISLADHQTFPSKTLSNMKEVYFKSKDDKILLILIFSCIGISLSLMQYLKKSNNIK